MFTGIIEDLGVLNIGQNSIRISTILTDIKKGDSIAVNGICLTATEIKPNGRGFFISMDVMPETFKTTNLRLLRTNEVVNLERALVMSDRVGGHFVLGHVEGIGTISAITAKDNAHIITINTLPNLLHNIHPKGSIAVDGISLTIVDSKRTSFSVSIVPETWQFTNFHSKKVGSLVNLETDYLLKKQETPTSKISYDFLKEEGYL